MQLDQFFFSQVPRIVCSFRTPESGGPSRAWRHSRRAIASVLSDRPHTGEGVGGCDAMAPHPVPVPQVRQLTDEVAPPLPEGSSTYKAQVSHWPASPRDRRMERADK